MALFRETLIYGLGGILPRLTGIITLPVISRYLTPEDYGAVAFVTSLSSIVSVLIGCGNVQTFARFYFTADTLPDRQRVESTWLSWIALSNVGLIGLMTLAALSPFILEYWPIADQPRLFLYALISIPFTAILNICLQKLRNDFRPWSAITVNISVTALGVALTIILVVAFGQGPGGVLLGSVLAPAIALPLAFVLSGLRVTHRPQLPQLIQMLKYGWPFAIATLVVAGLSTLDRVLVLGFLNQAALGQYAVAASLVAILAVAAQAFSVALLPRMLQAYEQDATAAAQMAAGLALPMCYVFGACTVAVAVFARPALSIIAGSAFSEAWLAVPTLAVAIFLRSCNPLAAIGLSLTKQTHKLTYGAGLALAVSALGFVFLIPRFGIAAPGFALTIGFIAQAVLCARLSLAEWPVPWRVGPITMMFLLILFASSIGYYSPVDPLKACAYATAICIAYLACGFAVGYVIQGWQLSSVWKRVLLLKSG